MARRMSGLYGFDDTVQDQLIHFWISMTKDVYQKLTSSNIFGSFFIIATASVEGFEYSCSLIHLRKSAGLKHIPP